MKKYFVTGTDTDCGKTFVTGLVLDNFNQRGEKAQALKPIASGGYLQDGKLLNEDVIHLTAHNVYPDEAINAWLYEEPISPHLAAKKRGERISAEEVATFCDKASSLDLEHLLIEGAGGLMVPLNESETWVDFLKLTKLPVILVVGMRLGCINHALLTGALLAQEEITSLGWIANCLDPNMKSLEENIATLTDKLSMPLLARVTYSASTIFLG